MAKAEERQLALRARGDDFLRMLQREENALRHERRDIAAVEELLDAGDVAGAVLALSARRARIDRKTRRSRDKPVG
ncbi:hypothetical protein KZX37_10910 [Microbacterium sp. EYE_5]|uniref:hypothetical protein n=1 Tax=Microbacterium sp. EYE_5 TaxID=2853447 RepID=UPI0020068A9B|nr:hypothetical protein [Microbacterium sp. EYE_5]MCK6218810.1 hypothetical protein [Microbacterium sp. EYE_5]